MNPQAENIYKIWLLALAMSELVADTVTFEWIEPLATMKRNIMDECERILKELGYRPTIKGLVDYEA